ncbi:hypothetical protein [Pectobacterium polaris]|uniref:hypothetical protein n=1 Tax=Pectobacterium polaris TaxID=2042057 RepID=UPI000F8C332B|nr:hypothetical protein [Pectobacterium polaris]RUR97822.1 hypothetical protein KHDHEBDM_02156 [Pectobacterium polaris]
MDIKEFSDEVETLKKEAKIFFDLAELECINKEEEYPLVRADRNIYWDTLSQKTHKQSQKAQEKLLEVIAIIIPILKNSLLLNDADEKDVGLCAKRMRATLRLRKFKFWDIEVLHDEGSVLGVSPPGQSEDRYNFPDDARKEFFECVEQLEDILQLIKLTPTNIPNGLITKNQNLPKSYKSNTAFIMMSINKSPENEDVYNIYKECFDKFGIKAVRADEIEHDEVITSKIIEEIKYSEFLLGDLTDERPSVYYEIGYAHSLERRVILYRKSGTSIHFDLAAYNCPEYKNNTELKSLLMKRLEQTTNRKPDQ